MEKEILQILPRYERDTNSIILFFPQIEVNRGKIWCTSPLNGSTEADLSYYHRKTEPPKKLKEVSRVVNWYIKNYHVTEPIQILERIPRR